MELATDKNLTDLTPQEWDLMPLRTRLWNYIKLVEYLYYQANKSVFKYEIFDKQAIGEIVAQVDAGVAGQLVIGERGCGKSFLYKLIQKVLPPSKRFVIINTIDVVTDFKTNGEGALSKYLGRNIVFDDLGFEKPGVHFGDKVDVIDYLVYKRFIEFESSGTLTSFISNLSLSQIEDRYNERTIDRMKGMCKKIIVSGGTQRLKMYNSFVLPDIYPIGYGKIKANGPATVNDILQSNGCPPEIKQELVELFKKQGIAKPFEDREDEKPQRKQYVWPEADTVFKASCLEYYKEQWNKQGNKTMTENSNTPWIMYGEPPQGYSPDSFLTMCYALQNEMDESETQQTT